MEKILQIGFATSVLEGLQNLTHKNLEQAGLDSL